MKRITLKIALVTVLTCCAMISNAVTPPPKPPKPPGHTNAPFDGGASLLIAAGVAYGIKKAYNSRKRAVN
jgi:hypothetical protein